jgi:hypothetical protein
MSRLLLIGLLLSVLVAQNQSMVFGFTTKSTPLACMSTNIPPHKKQSEKPLAFLTDTIGLTLLPPVDTIYIQSVMETTNEPVTAKYILKTSRRGDTLAAFQNAYKAVLPVPYALFLPIEMAPEFPFPHSKDVPYNDSIYPFKIVPTKNDQRLMGVTTFDLAMISRHVLGIQSFTSAYKLIAGDVNKDGSVDGSDIVMIRRLILRIDSVFKYVPHWVFVPKTYKIPDTLPHFDSIPKAYYFNAYSLNNPNPFEFVTIKMGDVNNSFHDTTTLSHVISSATRSSQKPLILTTENMYLEKGKTYELALKCTKKEQFMALQGTFSLKALVKAEITEGLEKASFTNFETVESETLSNFGEQNLNKSKDQIAFSWNDITDKVFRKNETLFKIKFTADVDGQLSDILKLNDDLSENIAYTEGGETRKIELQFSEPTKDFYVFQNEPNPFVDETTLRIEIKSQNGEATPVKYAVFDENGHLDFQQSQLFKSGIHLLRLNANEMGLTKAGLYFLNIETSMGKQTIKLLKM